MPMSPSTGPGSSSQAMRSCSMSHETDAAQIATTVMRKPYREMFLLAFVFG